MYTLPGLGGALDTSAQKEDRSIQNSLPKLEAEIDGQANIPDPQPAKITLGEPKTIGAPSEPNQAKRPMISTAMHPIKPSNNLKKLKKSGKNVKLQAVDMKGQELLNANLQGKIGVDTSLPPEMLDYANADIESQVRQGVDKDLQPAMSKSLSKIQKDVQEKEAERDSVNDKAVSDGQKEG